jgi:uncharacterized protein affecting Mg2+/Co2+ transport
MVAAQLISRDQITTDTDKRGKGPGVVAEWRFLRPDETFEYTSGTSMATGRARCAARIE